MGLAGSTLSVFFHTYDWGRGALFDTHRISVLFDRENVCGGNKMRNCAFTAFALTAIALLWSPSANANTITINGGESPTFPPTFTMLLSADSPVTLPTTSCCGTSNSFLVQASAEGTPNLSSGDFDSSSVT